MDEAMPSCCPLMVLDYIYAKCFQSKYQQATNIASEAFLNLIDWPRSGTDEKYKWHVSRVRKLICFWWNSLELEMLLTTCVSQTELAPCLSKVHLQGF